MILHGLFLCITSFVVGVILTWLFFAWRDDGQDSYLTDLLMKEYHANSILTKENLWKDKIILDLTMEAICYRSILPFDAYLSTFNKQDKEQCPE